MAARRCGFCELNWPATFLKPVMLVTQVYRCPACSKPTSLVADAVPMSDSHAKFEVLYAEREQERIKAQEAEIAGLPEVAA